MQVEIQNQASQQLNVKVAVRVRPLNQREIRENRCLETASNQIHLLQSQRLFSFDYVYDSDSTQELIFNQCVQGLVMRCFEGYNSTLLAYGQTGSGKTYTMGTSGEEQQDIGMIPRVVQLIFQETEKRKQELDITISCSYLELYNEQIIDLLVQNSDKCQPIIREEKNHTISILNLSSVVCTNPYDMLQILQKGGYQRQTAATLMNQSSSRSHALFTIYFQINQKDDDNEMGPLNAKFHFVDLAGSERLKKTLAVGKQMEEGIMINQSLLVLGNVINVLSEKKKQNQHIPYRESKLTRILQDSLGGNANTCMIACVSPSESNYEETLNTLKYASRAREIQNKPTQNRDPQVAQIMELKQQIGVLQSQIQTYVQVLKENNLEVKVINQTDTKFIGNCEDHQELINKLKSDLTSLQKQYNQQKQEFGSLSKALSESEIQLFMTRKQRDQISKQVTDLKKLLQKNNIPFGQNQIDDTVIFDQYQTEILSLKTILKDEQNQKEGMRDTIEKLLQAQKRDQTILINKQNQIFKLERQIEKYQELLPEVEFTEESIQEDENQVETDEGLKKQELDIETYESQLNYITQDTEALRQQIAQDLKEEYHIKINELEQQKALLQKLSTRGDTGQINNLKYRVAELESRIQEFKVKENFSKLQLKKLEDQENQVRDLRLLIEKMKKQKVEMIKKLKEENEKFHKFKEDKNKELFRVKKSKIQQDAQLKRLKHDILKKDLLIKRKEDEIFKQKQEKTIKSQSNRNKQEKKNNEVEFFQKQIDTVFEELLQGEQAQQDLEEDTKVLAAKQQEIRAIDQRMCQILIQQEQIKLDRKVVDQEKLDALESELSSLKVNRESSDESLEYLLHKLETHRKTIKSSNEYYQIFLNNSFFKDIPEWMIKTLRYTLESWVQTYLENQEKQQIIDLQSQNQLQQSVKQQESSISPNKRKYPKQSIEVLELKKQIQDQKRRYSSLQAELKSVHQDLEYYKHFYSQQTYKNRASLQARTESNQELPPSQNMQLQRDLFKLNKKEPTYTQSQKSLSFTMPQNSAKKKFFDKEVPLIADQMALSQEIEFESPIPDRNPNQRLSMQRIPNQFQYNFEPPLEFQLIKSFQAHDAAILNIFTWENLLFTTSIKSVRIWDLEQLTQISTLDVTGYARSVQYWPERNSFAISHGNSISFYDNHLSSLGTIKTSLDEIKVLCRHGSQLISGGKASINSGALQVWDYRQNNFVNEFEKGMEILTMTSCDNDLYWGTFNHQVKMMHTAQNRFGNIQILNPPHYDKVTGVGVLDDNIISCSFGRQLRLWNRNNYQITKDSSEIQKDQVNGMNVDSYNKIFYTAQKDGIVKAIKIVDGKFQHQADLIASNSSINTVSIIQQGIVATGGAEKMVKLWKPNFGQKYQLDDQSNF